MSTAPLDMASPTCAWMSFLAAVEMTGPTVVVLLEGFPRLYLYPGQFNLGNGQAKCKEELKERDIRLQYRLHFPHKLVMHMVMYIHPFY